MGIHRDSSCRELPSADGPEDADTRLAARILSEFREMPGLCLTASQAARLWGLEFDRCLSLLQALVATGRLRCLPQGRYVAAGRDGDER